ncbi:MAG: TerB family tellurite resistance protein [Clostridia bacterium]|nr:TerB family tellurite resistance protein [Clostridia bacterium]MBQ7094083.1 TerB family tellurite resistance protein [Clostridia bacterium]
MEKMKNYSEEFKFKFERFMTGCDSLEEAQAWDKEALGEMDVYYTNELVSIAIRLISSDGRFSGGEAQFMEDMFGFECTPSQLEDIYENCEDNLETMFDEGSANGFTLMKNINEKLADAYKELVALVCEIVMEADGSVVKAEMAVAEKIKAAVK